MSGRCMCGDTECWSCGAAQETRTPRPPVDPEMRKRAEEWRARHVLPKFRPLFVLLARVRS